ncbi:HNH endonuclease [Sporosarcina koreensis]|uniref:HNH endonuclease n=1 Tax=Sporosarcina koreensis TaxID=334735 RepID=UPI000757B92C|nr:HNH endonuclease [Sporosarcina koreensis]
MTKEIPLTKGKVAIVDDADYEELSKYSWYYEDHGYACRRKTFGYYESRKVYMHREIMKEAEDKVVDHINRDGLDNRRANLRIVSQSLNLFNSGVRVNNTSGFKGVSRSGERWRSRIYVDGKEKSLGVFDCKIEAALAYNESAKKLYGDHAFLNKIELEEDVI